MDEILFQSKIRSELSKRPNGKITDTGSGMLKIKAGGAVTGIKADWVGVLVNEALQCFYGKFHSVDEDANAFEFELDDMGKYSGFKEGDSIYYFDSYWGERVELVLDRNADWTERKFSSVKAIQVGNMIREFKEGGTQPEGTVVVDGGWDHEHCEICMETIDEVSESGFKNRHGQWLCGVCVVRYYENTSLGFID